MKRSLLATALVLAAAACTPDIEKTEAPSFVVARFDPSQSPPVVPTPNDLAQDPATGRLNVTAAPGASDADVEFAAYLSQLNGFPASSTAKATFTDKLNPASVNTQTLRVLDVTDNYAEVTNAVPAYSDREDPAAPGVVQIDRTGGWTPGHTYLLAVVGGASGMKGADGRNVVGSSTWALIRSEASLVTCTDLKSPDCKSVTSIIPAEGATLADEQTDRNKKAVQLEQLRLKYKPSIEKLTSLGIAREDIALAWSFEVSDDVAMVFNPSGTPPAVPTPNDLAIDRTTGLVNAPVDPNATPAQQEFIRDYVNSLNGFPVVSTAAASVAGGDLDPASVNAGSVLVLDLTPGATQPTVTVTYDSAKHQIVIPPPAGGWTKGHQYAVAVVGGENGVKGSGGQNVVASEVWALARSSATLVNCEDLTDPTCAPVFTISDLTHQEAVALETVRQNYAPFLDALEAKGVPRSDVSVGWTFRIMNHPEVQFDPAKQIIPFPNDLLRNPTTGKLQLPNPTNNPLIAGLNTLNGWSLTAPAVTENGFTTGPLTDDAGVDPASLSVGADGGTALFVPLAGNGLPPRVIACVSCAVSHSADGGTVGPQTLEFVPEVPLAENTTYGAAITTSVKDTKGREVRPTLVFALMRMQNTLVKNCPSQPSATAPCESTVEGVTGVQATVLEPLRVGHKALMDALAAAGTPRKNLGLAWAFTTQTVVNGNAATKGLRQYHDESATAGVDAKVDYLLDITAQVKGSGLPATNIAQAYQGSFTSPFLLTGPGGMFGGPTRLDRISFTLTLPDPTQPNVPPMPTGGWPVVIFGHGIRGDRNQSLAIANTLATAGFATIFIDTVFHGERSSCAGVASVLGQVTDDAACADPTTQTCDNASGVGSPTYGYCIARVATTRLACTDDQVCIQNGQGRCLGDNKCAGGDFKRNANGAPVFSGWNFINTANLFATRDNFRQQVVDLGQFARVIADTTATASLNARLTTAGSGTLDASKINYAGISLGGILGSLYVAVAPEVHRAVLNVPGGDPTNILLTAPAFATARTQFLAGLAQQGVTPGSPAFDQFMYFAHAILDPADPQNVGYELNNGANAPSDRATLIQYITQDQVVPNSSTDRLIAAATRTDAPKQSAVFQFDPPVTTSFTIDDRHGFLLNAKDLALTGQAQTQLATFLLTGQQP